MCELNAYIKRDDHETLLMEGVFVVKPEAGKVVLENLFGEQKVIDAKISQVSLMEHKIIFDAFVKSHGMAK